MTEQRTASVTVCAGPKELAKAAAERVVECSERAILSNGRFTIALSGGSTPGALFKLLGSKKYRDRIDWSVTHLFWSDERCVAPTDRESNFRLVNETLLNPPDSPPLDIPKENIHRIQAELNEAGADAYDDELREFFGIAGTAGDVEGGGHHKDKTPAFDLLLLGLGPDGHIASIFPESHLFDNHTHLAQLVYAEHLDSWRISLTPKVIRSAKKLLLLVSGTEKAQMLHRLFTEETGKDVRQIPARMLFEVEVNAEWLVDSAAHSLIGKQG
ncbi:MAG: 6-phosphogluconolactonase [Proteobacteria bacterium]|nr:6-phosphogluconolactonase [Pseudomonadota bacterium]